MNVETEQVFIVNVSELDQQIATPLQRAFTIPGSSLQTEEAQTNMCLQQSMNIPSRTQMCRLCAAVTEMVVPIFHGEGLQNNLADKIHQHLPIRVSEDDLLPVVICFQCTSTLLAWHELVVCSIQADAVMRKRFNMSYSQQQQQPPPDAQSSQEQIKDEKSQPLLKIIKNVLTKYSHSLNMDSQVELVCQRCDNKPASTAEHFSEHLITVHHDEVRNENALNSFIKEHVTFEEPLLSDLESDDRDDSDSTESPKAVKNNSLPTLLCPYCDSAFSSASRLIYHMNKHMEICIEEGVQCCDSTYNTKKDFVSHLQEKHVKRSVLDTEAMCKSCNFTADSVQRLRHHVEECHSESKIKKSNKKSDKNQKWIPAVCPECNRTFSNKYNMFAHMKSHGEAATHACPRCDKRYSTKGNLRQHVKLIHDGVMEHACGACGERFPTRAARDVHARLHSGARPYRCGECGAAFRAHNSLQRHRDMHLDVRSHACRLCGKAFRKRSHLEAHVRAHRG